MLKKTTRWPSGNTGPGCQVACPGSLNSKYRSPLPSAPTMAVLPCEVKNKRSTAGSAAIERLGLAVTIDAAIARSVRLIARGSWW